MVLFPQAPARYLTSTYCPSCFRSQGSPEIPTSLMRGRKTICTLRKQQTLGHNVLDTRPWVISGGSHPDPALVPHGRSGEAVPSSSPPRGHPRGVRRACTSTAAQQCRRLPRTGCEGRFSPSSTWSDTRAAHGDASPSPPPPAVHVKPVTGRKTLPELPMQHSPILPG